jgi:uncharacterized membrane protein HdeD (DUF308 family)
MEAVGLMLIIGGLVLLSGSLYVIPAMGKYLEKLAKWLGGFQGAIGIVSIIVALVWWDGLYSVFLIVVGLILAASIMSMIPALGKSIAKLTKFLGAFQVIIGIIALILGIVKIV